MDEKMNFTDKKMKIKTGTGVVVNITCSYAEDKTLEELFLLYLERENATKLAALQWGPDDSAGLVSHM